MRRITSRSLSLALIAACSLVLTGCVRNRTKGELPYVARDVGTLYRTAQDQLAKHNYKLAAALFDEVERQHPYSIWARRAELMSAFSYYADDDYTKSIASAQRFISVHPGNRDADYAYYLIAIDYYNQIADVTRDQKITQQALDALNELIRLYPDSRYAQDARLKVDLVTDHLAGKEMEIGRFYEMRGQWLAAAMRFRTVVSKFQVTSHVPEALERLTEVYLALGLPDQAQQAAAVLGANYPGSWWYQRAYKIIKDHPVPPGTVTSKTQASGPDIVTRGEAGTQGNMGMTGSGVEGRQAPTAPAPAPPTPTTTGGATTGS